MLSEYINDQKIITNILNKSINKEKYSHAYLFELNDYELSEQLIIDFIKHIICFKDGKLDEIQSKNVENNNHPDFFIIEAEKNIIKKDQLTNLQKEFSKKSSVNGKRVYLIKNAENMNASAYNSILKFIEEPNPNIIAILTTNNIYNLNKTIISRCQVLNFDNINSNNSLNKYLTEDIDINNIINFISVLETQNIKTIAYTKKNWFNIYKDKKNIVKILNIIVLIYKDILNYKIKGKLEYIEDKSFIEKLSYQDNIIICNKINLFVKYISLIKYNLNENLFIDKLIIDFGGIKNESIG